MTDYRKGSMGEADAKNNKIYLIALAVVYTLIVGTFFIGDLYPHQWFMRTSFVFNFLGVASVIAWYGLLAISWTPFINDTVPQPRVWFSLIGLLALSVALLAGFNFSL